jgi:DNA-binding transcriptional ArsR family regulator
VLDDAFRAMGEPRRREILVLLSRGELAAGDIAGRIPDISRPAVSQHLRVLKDARLIDERRDGRRRVYRLGVQRLEAVRTYLAGFWDVRLATLKDRAEREAKTGRGHRRGRADRRA